MDYAKFKDIVNSTFNLGGKILEPKIVRKILRSLPERFHTKTIGMEESKDIDKIPLTELVGNLQIYELGLAKIGKGGKSKNMTLKIKDNEDEEFSKAERTKFKPYIMRQFKIYIKNSNLKMNEKDSRKFEFISKKSLDKPNKENKEGGQNTNIPSSLKCFGCQGYGHIKQECPT